jgi:hypothetical protein
MSCSSETGRTANVQLSSRSVATVANLPCKENMTKKTTVLLGTTG